MRLDLKTLFQSKAAMLNKDKHSITSTKKCSIQMEAKLTKVSAEVIVKKQFSSLSIFQNNNFKLKTQNPLKLKERTYKFSLSMQMSLMTLYVLLNLHSVNQIQSTFFRLRQSLTTRNRYVTKTNNWLNQMSNLWVNAVSILKIAFSQLSRELRQLDWSNTCGFNH